MFIRNIVTLRSLSRTTPYFRAQVFWYCAVERCARVPTARLPMKFLFLLWITIRGTFDAAIWATAVWCLLYSLPNVSWPHCFWAFLAFHFIGNLPAVKYINTHTRQECFSYMRYESRLAVLSIISAPLISIIPTVGAIILLTFLQVWTSLETHWLHTWLFVTCIVYLFLKGREKRRMTRPANSTSLQRSGGVWKLRADPEAQIVMNGVVEQPPREEWARSPEPSGKVTRSSPRSVNGSRSGRVIDV